MFLSVLVDSFVFIPNLNISLKSDEFFKKTLILFNHKVFWSSNLTPFSDYETKLKCLNIYYIS